MFVKSKEGSDTSRGLELSHFIIHTGAYQKSRSRTGLTNKHEIINVDNKVAREQVSDYIYNTYKITDYKFRWWLRLHPLCL